MSTLHLLTLPNELRYQIWGLVFSNQHVIPTQKTFGVLESGCETCAADGRPGPPTMKQTFEPLLTCKQMFQEAVNILQSSMTVELRKGILDFSWLTWPIQPINHKVRCLILWAHVHQDNKNQWGSGISLIGRAFPNLEELVIHAHMRPPENYQVLSDAMALAAPIVRLGRDKSATKVTLKFNYSCHRVILDSPQLGRITTADSVEEHELVLQDLIEDDAFVEAALAQDEDEQAMAAALLRVVRSHEQPWFEKLGRRREQERRQQEQQTE